MDIDRLKSIRLKQFDFCKSNNILPLVISKSVACSISLDSQLYGIDVQAEVINSIETEISSSILNDIMSHLNKSHNIDYIDVRNIDDDNQYDLIYKKITEKSNINGYKSFITNGRIGSILAFGSHINQYSSWKVNSSLSNMNNYCYSIGQMNDINVYVNAYLRYDSDEIYLFDEIESNFEILNFRSVSDATFRPKLIIDYKSGFNFGKIETIHLVREDDPKRIEEYKNYMLPIYREEKINTIIN